MVHRAVHPAHRPTDPEVPVPLVLPVQSDEPATGALDAEPQLDALVPRAHERAQEVSARVESACLAEPAQQKWLVEQLRR